MYASRTSRPTRHVPRPPILSARGLPSTSVVYLTITILELVLGVLAGGLGFWWRSIGPGAQFGMILLRSADTRTTSS